MKTVKIIDTIHKKHRTILSLFKRKNYILELHSSAFMERILNKIEILFVNLNYDFFFIEKKKLYINKNNSLRSDETR